jgi:hypothetical protein
MSKQSARPIDPRKISTELFTLTYGAFVAQLIKDYENCDEVNKQLDQVGYNIGIRMVEDFLARSPQITRCSEMKETAEVLSKQAFKMFLGVQAQVAHWNETYDEFSLILETNPLIEFVELPEDGKFDNLSYSQVICGAIRGALETLQIKVECFVKSDHLKGDSFTEIRVKFIEKLLDAVPIGEE